MIFVVFFLLLLRYSMLYFESNMLYFAFFATLIIVTFSFLKAFDSFNRVLSKIDTAFFDLEVVQFLLWVSVQFETCLSGRNYFLTQISFFSIPVLVIAYLYGLVKLSSADSCLDPLSIVEIVIVVWVTFYLRLRFRYLNYASLEIDQPVVSWNQLMKRFETKQDIIVVDRRLPDFPVALASIRYSTYQGFKKDLHLAYQSRNMLTIAKTVTKTAVKAAAENPSAVTTAVGVGVTVGVSLYTSAKVIESQDRQTAAINRQTESQDRQTTATNRQTESQDRQTAAINKQTEVLKGQQASSGPNQPPPSNVSLATHDSQSVVSLDGSRVEDFVFFV